MSSANTMTAVATDVAWDQITLQFPATVMTLVLTGDGEALTGVHFGAAEDHSAWLPSARRDPGRLAAAAQQLRAYAAGELTRFDLPMRLRGTSFQMAVWNALTEIPYGRTVTYGQIASAVGRPRASRAVGSAVGSNPIGIVIPCHRVVGADGSLTGFGGGLHNKIALLAREGVTAL